MEGIVQPGNWDSTATSCLVFALGEQNDFTAAQLEYEVVGILQSG